MYTSAVDLLRKLNTKVVRQDEQHLKHELYQTIDTFLSVTRDRASNDVVSYELAWGEGGGRTLTVSWKHGAAIKTGQVDDGEGMGSFKRARVDVKSRIPAGEIIDRAKKVVEERGTKLPADLQQRLWQSLGMPGPGAMETKRRTRTP